MKFLDTAAILGIATVLATVIESMVEYIFGTPMDRIEKLKPYKWLLMYVALVFGVGVTFYYKIDLIAALPVWFTELAGQAPPEYEPTSMGIALTGLVIGRGSNFLHQIMTKFFPVKPKQE